MKITTSWMEQGLQQGIGLGLNRERELLLRLLKRKLGQLDTQLEAQIKTLDIDNLESLGEALLDFNTIDDLVIWLTGQPQ